jgi:hypothetical protein
LDRSRQGSVGSVELIMRGKHAPHLSFVNGSGESTVAKHMKVETCVQCDDDKIDMVSLHDVGSGNASLRSRGSRTQSGINK